MIMRANVTIAILLSAALHAQTPDAPGAPVSAPEVKGIATRASAAEYQTAVKVGNYTLAVDFDANGVPTSDGVFSTEEYIVFEVALYGPPGSHAMLQLSDFSLKINGKKQPTPAQPYTFVFKSLKNPEWESTLAYVPKESSNGINAGGGGGRGAPADSGPPPKPKMPIAIERKMELRVQKAAVSEADRPLPQTGLIFFPYSGRIKNIHTMDLIFSGAIGKVTIPMQP